MKVIDILEEKYINAEVILIHIPKTAGSTILTALRSKIDLLYLHVNGRRTSYAAHFIPRILENTTKKVIVTWRDPVEHVFSCFNFYQQYPDIKASDNLFEFIEDPKLHNMQTSFLTRDKLLQEPIVSDDDFNIIKLLLNRPNTLFILTDYIEQGLEKVKEFLNIESINNTTKRFNYNKPPSFLIPQEIRKKIYIRNEYDTKIYNQIVEKFKYNQESSFDDIILNSPPYYFPFIWLIDNTNLSIINKRKEELINTNDKLKNILPCSIKTYINNWLDNYKSNVNNDILYLPDNYNDLIQNKQKLYSKILTAYHYDITRY